MGRTCSHCLCHTLCSLFVLVKVSWTRFCCINRKLIIFQSNLLLEIKKMTYFVAISVYYNLRGCIYYQIYNLLRFWKLIQQKCLQIAIICKLLWLINDNIILERQNRPVMSLKIPLYLYMRTCFILMLNASLFSSTYSFDAHVMEGDLFIQHV